MAEIIENMQCTLFDNAKQACENADVTPLVMPIRGGTDGCTVKHSKDFLARTLVPVDMHTMDRTSTSQSKVWIRQLT